MKRKMRGLQVKCKIGSVHYLPEIEHMTVDCHLGSPMITIDELFDYLEARDSQSEEQNNSAELPTVWFRWNGDEYKCTEPGDMSGEYINVNSLPKQLKRKV